MTYYDLKIGAKTYKAADRESPGWQKILETAYRHEIPIVCLCPTNGSHDEKRLRVAQRDKDLSDSFYLASFKRRGYLHVDDCKYHSVLPSSGQAYYEADVIQKTDTGYKVRLDYAVKVAQLKDTPDTGDAPSTKPKDLSGTKKAGKQRAIRLKAFLNFLWDIARFNIWDPRIDGTRTWLSGAKKLDEVAKQVQIQNGTTSFVDQLVLDLPDDAPRTLIEASKQALATGKANNERRIMIGFLGDCPSDADELPWWLPSRNQAAKIAPVIKMDAGQWALLKQNAKAWTQWQAREPVIFIAHLQYEGSWVVINIALQPTIKLIPVESANERQLANQLIAGGRVFARPLPYDAPDDAIRPDFVLLDTAQEHYPLEVHEADKYVPHAIARTAFYAQHYKGFVWTWDSSKHLVPALPSAASASS